MKILGFSGRSLQRDDRGGARQHQHDGSRCRFCSPSARWKDHEVDPFTDALTLDNSLPPQLEVYKRLGLSICFVGALIIRALSFGVYIRVF